MRPSAFRPEHLNRLAVDLAGDRLLRITISGTSMQPALRTGDAVLVDPSRRNAPAVGQIVTFMQGETMVTHRIVAAAAGAWLTKGDAMRAFDAPVGTKQLVGVVVAAERLGRPLRLPSDAAAARISRIGRVQGEFEQACIGKRSIPWRIFRTAVHGFYLLRIRLAAAKLDPPGAITG